MHAQAILSLSSFLQKAGAWPLVALVVIGIVVLSLLVGSGSARAPSGRRAFRNDAAGKNVRTGGSAGPKEGRDLEE